MPPAGRRADEPRAAFGEARTIDRSLALAFPGVASNAAELKQVEQNLRALDTKSWADSSRSKPLRA